QGIGVRNGFACPDGEHERKWDGHLYRSAGLPRLYWGCDNRTHRHRRRGFQGAADVVGLAPSPCASWLRKSTAHCLFLAVAGAGICFVSDERGSTLNIWRTPIAVRDLVFHSRGERTHQRTNADSQWGLISLPPEQLAACAKALTGLKITSPPTAPGLRPSWSAAGPLRRLHSKVCPFAETR